MTVAGHLSVAPHAALEAEEEEAEGGLRRQRTVLLVSTDAAMATRLQAQLARTAQGKVVTLQAGLDKLEPSASKQADWDRAMEAAVSEAGQAGRPVHAVVLLACDLPDEQDDVLGSRNFDRLACLARALKACEEQLKAQGQDPVTQRARAGLWVVTEGVYGGSKIRPPQSSLQVR